MTQERRVVLNSHEIGLRASAAPYVIGADIGATNLRLALADNEGAMLGRWSTSTTRARDAEAVVRLMREGVDALLREASPPHDAIGAIAVGAPGVTNADSGIVIATSYLMGWRDVPLRDLLEAEFKIPAAVDNDVNLAAIGEQGAGVAKGQSNFVFLAIGTGIGAGIVMNGQIHHGSAWTAGEIGYMLVPGTSEAPVELGEPGALEAIAGGEGIRNQWQKRWREDLTTLSKDATATEIFDHALKSDAVAQEVLHLAGRTLAYGIYNISLILNCPLFVLGGTVGIHPALGDAIRQALEQRRVRVQPKLVRSALGVDAQLVGAIYLAIETVNKQFASPGS
jgi:glucokinase